MVARTSVIKSIIRLGLAIFLYAAPLAFSQTATFINPIVTTRDAADPWITFRDGYYYFTFTAGDHVEVWKSSSLTDIDRGTKITVWRHHAAGKECCNIWAPELHFFNDRWYIYFAADDGNDVNHRMYVLESTGSDPQGAYLEKGEISSPSNRWAIDGTVLQKNDGSLYFVWSGWAGTTPGPQNIYIAPMSNPWTISAERTLISAPTNVWESIGWSVNEGPEPLQRNGKIFIVYSASGGSTPDYCLGMLTNYNGNVLDPNSWTKSPGCVFAKTDLVFGPGHNSFVKSTDGVDDWIIYHARNSSAQTWDGRTTRMQRFTWNSDGTPNFSAPVPPAVTLPIPSGEIRSSSATTAAPAPILLTEEKTEQAVAIESVAWVRSPFSLLNSYFSPDQRSRIMLFALNINMAIGESPSTLTAQAEDAQGNIYPVKIEFMVNVPNFDWLTELSIILPDELGNSGDVRVRINARGTFSNKVLITLKP
jgi:GH43 family beta-xylosidase